MRAACDGDLNRVARVVKLVGFVNATAEFDKHHLVLNGASDLMGLAFGDKGKHSRCVREGLGGGKGRESRARGTGAR